MKFRIILLALLWSVFIICFCSGIYYLCYIYLCKTWKFYLTFYAGKTNISSFDFFFAFMICDISYYVFNILCASFHIWKFYFSKYFKKKDIKLFFTGGEKSILNFSKFLVLYYFFIINAILKGGEIVLNFYIFSNFSYIYFLPKYFQIILTYVISYIFLKYFWNSKEWILLLKCFLKIHTLKHKGG